MTDSKRAGEPAQQSDLINVAQLTAQYYVLRPEAGNAEHAVKFGTSGHRGSAGRHNFNEQHILAIAQAIAEDRARNGITGPCYVGKDTHALSEPAFISVLEVLAANGVDVIVQEHNGFTPTPAISNAILVHNKKGGPLADGIVITQGFIGSEAKGRTTTLGRGGSDYTAALLGEALHATRVDIWTDVPGIYTTDPRVVSAAKRIDVIAFEEAAEMATFGAKVLHPATLLPAVRSDIPVFVGSSKDPKAGGTLVCKKTENPPLFRALALRRKQTLVTLHSHNMLHSRGFLAEVFGILARHNISVDLITTSEVSIALTLDTTGSTSTGDTLLTQSLLIELSELCRVEVEENLALVAIIGNKLSRACGVGKEVFGVLDPFNIRMICYGASSYNLCFLVPAEQAEQVVQKLHQNLFE